MCWHLHQSEQCHKLGVDILQAGRLIRLLGFVDVRQVQEIEPGTTGGKRFANDVEAQNLPINKTTSAPRDVGWLASSTRRDAPA